MKTLLYLWKLNLLSLMEYKLSFFLQVGFMIVNDFLFAFLWYLFFLKFKTIGGLIFNDFLLLFSIMTMVFGLMHVFFGGFNKIGIMIEEGKLDSQMLLPKNLFFRLLAGSMMTAAIGDIFFSFILMTMIEGINIYMIFKILILSLIGVAVFLGFMMIFVSLSFFIGSSKSIVKGVFEAILGPTHYPPGIFEGTFLKFVFMTVIPAFYIVFLPFELIKNFSLNGFLQLLLGSIIFFGLGYFTFYKGLKRYESGNMININI
nr:ABC-2 family transporter protein [Candidatus Gracilibacteria bacterium]